MHAFDLMKQIQDTLLKRASFEAKGELRGAGNLSATAVIEIYARAYSGRMNFVLGETYAPVKRLLGATAFEDIVTVFVARHPSTVWNLANYGEGFPEILSSQVDPHVSDVARACWMFHKQHDLPLADGLSPGDVATELENGGENLRLRADVEIFSSRYAVYDLWRDGDTFGVSRPQAILFARTEDGVFACRLSPAQVAITEALREGVRDGQAWRHAEASAEASAEATDEETADLFGYLSAQKLLLHQDQCRS